MKNVRMWCLRCLQCWSWGSRGSVEYYLFLHLLLSFGKWKWSIVFHFYYYNFSNSILRLRSAHYWGKNDNLAAAAQCEIQKLPFFRSLFDRKIPHFYAGFHSHAEDKIEVCTTERRLSELRKKSRSFSLSIYEEGWSKQLFKFILSLICNILSENHNSTIWRPFKNAFKTLWGVVASTSTRPRIHISPEP